MRWLIAAVLALLLPVAASAEPAPSQDCFISSSWRGWSAPQHTDALYLRVRGNVIYRVGLTQGSHVRRYSGEFLVNQVRGSSWICSALDLDLALMDYNGISRPLIATDLHRLTPEEVAAIPAEDLPY